MVQIILEQINEVSKFCVGKNISYIKFDYTKDYSILTQIGINGYNIYLEIFFDVKSDTVEDVCVNVYKDKKCKFAYGGTMKDCLKRITDEIKFN